MKGDLIWDAYTPKSILVFGNIDDHANQLSQLGGVRRYCRYSPLQNGKRWNMKMGRTDAFVFTLDLKQKAIEYVNAANKAIETAYNQANSTSRASIPGTKVITPYGYGIILNGSTIQLDKPTYNCGWKGLPEIYVTTDFKTI